MVFVELFEVSVLKLPFSKKFLTRLELFQKGSEDLSTTFLLERRKAFQTCLGQKSSTYCHNERYAPAPMKRDTLFFKLGGIRFELSQVAIPKTFTFGKFLTRANVRKGSETQS